MRRPAAFAPFPFAFLLATVSLLSAQSITITPAAPTVVAGQTVQFAAQVTGLSHPGVTWSVAGVKGGNSTVGMISAKGLYRAPATPPGQDPVQVTATSVANTTISGSTFPYIIKRGPSITSVSPNPMPVGAVTVTIQGTGFRSGAEVLDTYSGFPVQFVTTKVTQTTITATGYQGPATSASFCVKNSGSACGNSISVPVTGGSGNYTLTVVNGSGSGTYATGAVVTISANPPPTGEVFTGWTGATVQNSNASTTALTMPAANTTVTANYGAPGSYTLTVVNGTGSGTYATGTVVTISANAPPPGQVFADWTGASVQNPNASTTTLTMPASSVTVTANYSASATYTLTVVNGTGSGNYPAGTSVPIAANAPPTGEVFVNWTGAAVQDATSSATSLTMPAANTTVTANFATPPPIPFPVTGHPRLWVTQNTLPTLQSWANSSNPIYQQGMAQVLAQAVNIYNTQFFPGGVPNPNYPDPGDTQGYTGYLTEQYGAVLAFNSLIDPNPSNRILYAQYARNLIMYAMNIAVLGPLSNAPFRDPMFPTYNRANGQGEQWGLIVDWIYNATDASGNPILSASDKTTIRNVFLIWANECLNASTAGGDHPTPVGVTNSLQLLPNNLPYRMASNNYYIGHARHITMMALSMDPTDDSPVNPGLPASHLGNTLRSYISNATGAWLYQQYAMMGEAATVVSAYGIGGSGAGFGLASGGLPPEGMLYGESFGFLLGQLLALQTAGFNNVSYSGPQIQLIGSPVWDRYVIGFLSSLTPTSQVPPTETWLGPVYQFDSYGDLLRLYVTPDYMRLFALLALLEQQNGETTHLDTARWFVVNVPEGGPSGLYTRITDPWSFTETILFFMLMDPSAAPGTDPRPSYPTYFYDPGAGRIVAHSDWSPTNTMFDYRASWESINHQDGDGGQFEFFRNGEWLTKEMSNYDNNGVGLTTVYHNTLALQNTCTNGTPSNLQWYESGEWANGSQWILGTNNGDPTTITSTGPGYVYAASNLTNLYNRPDFWSPPDAAMNITQATRSIVWFHNDYVVNYDRATSQNTGLFKQLHLSLVTSPVINGHVATETMPDGQQLFIQTLLPLDASLSSFYGAGNLNPIAELEPTQYIFQVADPAMPADTRFLQVLQGANPGVAMSQATYVQSTGNTAFDGAVFGNAAIYFPRSASAMFSGATFTVPSSVQTMLVTGLNPNTTYGVSIQPNGSSTAITVSTSGTGGTSDSAGVLLVTP